MDGIAASHDVIRVVPDEALIAPGYLYAFLCSKLAQAMILQAAYGSVVQHIEPIHIANLPVPIPEPHRQDEIHQLVVKAAAARSEASSLLGMATDYFDVSAGSMPSPDHHSRAIGIAQRFQLASRLDAFHYIGWAREGRSLPGTPLGEMGRVTRPGIFRRIFVERGVPLVSGIDVYQVRPTFRQQLMRSEAIRGDCLIERGQVLVQRSGQRYGLLGRPAFVGRRMHGWSVTEDLMRISLDALADTARVFAFLASDVGRRRLLRTSYGTSIPHLNPDGLARVQIPVLPDTLLTKVKRALLLREQSDVDEEGAIREVESWLS
jgi:type I restriction enzyme S subunit